jgi:hypothetical protein
MVPHAHVNIDPSRKLAHSYAALLKSNNEWRDYYKSGEKPADIPNVPHKAYVCGPLRGRAWYGRLGQGLAEQGRQGVARPGVAWYGLPGTGE